MKYANVSKAKFSKWHKVWGPKFQDIAKARDWCNDQPSNAKFFNRYKQPYWYFESQHDAVMFAMKWSVDPEEQDIIIFKLQRTRVNAKSRKLKASWSMSTP